MSNFAQAGTTFTVTVDESPVGLGVLGFTLIAADGTEAIARTTAGVALVAGTDDSFEFTGTAPTAPGIYRVRWDNGSGEYATDTLEVTPGLVVLPPTGAPDFPRVADVRDLAQATQRFVRGRPATLAYTFGEDEDGTPDGPVTVTVIDSDGYVIVGEAPAERVGETHQYRLRLPAAALPRIDLLAAVWSYAIDTEPVQTVTTLDVVERRLFTIGEMRRRYKQFDDEVKWPAERIEEARTEAEDFLADACNVALVRRYGEELHPARAYTGASSDLFVLLRRNRISAVRSVTTGGRALTAEQLATVQLSGGALSWQRRQAWRGDIRVAYEHGQPVTGAARAARILARDRLLNGPLDDRAIAIPVEGGGSVPLLTPGKFGSRTGIPEVDEFIQSNQLRDARVS